MSRLSDVFALTEISDSPYAHEPYTAAPTDPLVIYCDGAVHYEEPRFGVWGWVAVNRDTREVASATGWVGWQSSEQLEYEAVIQALLWAHAHARGRPIECRTDSLTVVRQVENPPPLCPSNLLHFRLRAKALKAATAASLIWVPRKQNTRAHWLCASSKKAYLSRHRQLHRPQTAAVLTDESSEPRQNFVGLCHSR